MTTSRDVLLWIDTETTAIRPEEGDLLEIGMRVTDMTGNPLANKYGGTEFSRVILPKEGINLNSVSLETIYGMHRDNGLVRESLLSGTGQDETVSQTVEWLETVREVLTPDRLIIAGTNPQFDLDWIHWHLHDLAAYLDQVTDYHRMDMTALRLALATLGPHKHEHTTHRVDDCLDRDTHEYQQTISILRHTKE